MAPSWVGFVALFFLSFNLVLYNLSFPIKACDWPAMTAMDRELNPDFRDQEYPSLKQKAAPHPLSLLSGTDKKKKNSEMF